MARLILLIFLSGCSFHRTTDITVEGEKLKTPYGMGDVNTHYKSETTFQWGCLWI